MTKPARGVFRAISSFARFVTPSAPGSLSINKSGRTSPTRSGEVTPDPTSRAGEQNPILREPLVETPFYTPIGSATDLGEPVLGEPVLGEPVLGEPASVGKEVPKDTQAISTPPLPRSSTTQGLRAQFDFSRQNSASSSRRPSISSGSGGVTPLQARSSTTALAGDDAGPRFGGDHAEQDNRALPGTAGHSGIYRGPDVRHVLLVSTFR